jgi:hypothetical protein
MDHRVAFVVLVALLIGAGAPLAFAWARLLPEDDPPFPIEPGSFPSVDHEAPQEPTSGNKDYFVAVPLLFCVTVAFVFRVPGFPGGTLLARLGVAGSEWGAIAAHVGVALFAIGAAVFGALRPGPLRVPFIAAGALTLILWFLGPVLVAAVLAGT